MDKIFRSSVVMLLIVSAGLIGFAQRPRTTTQDVTENSTTVPGPPPAPPSVKAKYEGGVFGYNKKMDGTLNFDDASGRFIFRNSKGKEILFVPYKSITAAAGDTHRVQPASATVAQKVPSIYALPAHFIKTKVRYLTLQYSDPDSNVSGTTSFKLDNQEILDSVLVTLANKSGLTKRGEVFVRKKDQTGP